MKYLFDVFIFNVRNIFDDVYCYVKGEVILYLLGYNICLLGELFDFVVVMDYVEFLGVLFVMVDLIYLFLKVFYVEDMFSMDWVKVIIVFNWIVVSLGFGKCLLELDILEFVKLVWFDIIKVVECYYEFGFFMILVVYEYMLVLEG